MRILVIGNFSDVRCGFMNFSNQTVIALLQAGHEVQPFDGTYSKVYARHQQGVADGFLPPDAASYDVIHVIWHPATLNHYSGCTWPAGPVLSVWNGCPAAWCPFTGSMDIRWGVLGKEGPEPHQQIFYPIPDWFSDEERVGWRKGLAPGFRVGYSGVRGDGLAELKAVCEKHAWATNFSSPDKWYSIEEEVARLATSTVNVGWYGAEHDDRSGSAMMCLASRRPFLCNNVRMFAHVAPYAWDDKDQEIYMNLDGEDLETMLVKVEKDYQRLKLHWPKRILAEYAWTRACQILEEGWKGARK